MQMPSYQPHVTRMTGSGQRAQRFDDRAGLTPQGCNLFACAAAVAQCVANPNPVQCILNIAPNCLDCIPH
jgi:hypothetical protein